MLWYIMVAVMDILMLGELVWLYCVTDRAAVIVHSCRKRIHALEAENREKDKIIARYKAKESVRKVLGGANDV